MQARARVTASPEVRQRTQTRGHEGPTTSSRRTSGTQASGPAPRRRDDRFTRLRTRLQADRALSRGQRVTVYLNGRGGRLEGGYEDAAANQSSIVWGEGLRALDVPAFAGGTRAWDSVVSCVQGHFDRYDVDIVSQRPTSGQYIMMMVGGRPGMLGYSGSVAGVAPFSGTVIDGSVGFVFSETVGNHAQSVCETAAHEIGHTMGLDHTYECRDLMSYLDGCGEKSFLDQSMHCGEWGNRNCAGGVARQNSHATLVRQVGLRASSGPKTPSRPPPRTPPPVTPPPTPPADTRGPRVSIQSTQRFVTTEGTIFVVEASVRDESDLASVDLMWQADGRTVAYRCGKLPAQMPIECERTRDGVSFTLLVGEGMRRFALRARDAKGNTSTSGWRRTTFSAPEPTWPEDDDAWYEDEDEGGGDYGCS